MIAEVLSRQFVLSQLSAVKNDLAEALSSDRRSGAPDPVTHLSSDDLRNAITELEAAETREAVQSGNPVGSASQSERRSGEQFPDLDDRAFISRDPVLSNLQSALDEYFEELWPSSVISDDDDRRGVASNGAEVSDRRILDQFSITDIRWVSSAFAMGITAFRKKHPFNERPATERRIADRARVILVGDWGTGLPRAVNVAEQIARVLAEGHTERREQHVIHLGDVYYSGWPREYRERFLKFWPVTGPAAHVVTSWSLNANHDMYSGGHAYYNTLLADARFRAQEASSFFCLTNASWRILGLDTGWTDGDLQWPQPKWLREQTTLAEQQNQNVVCLSHHQLFSAFEDAGALLRERLADTPGGSRIHSWFWGHEHRCTVHGPHNGLSFSACLGHGGVPVYMTRADDAEYPPPVLYEHRDRITKGLESWALFGFAVLDLDGANANLKLIDENGVTHYDNAVPAAFRT